MMDAKTCSRREMLGAAAVGWFALSTPQDPIPDSALRARTVVFVRHAEKDEKDEDDPVLTERGKKRADLLASLFAAAGVTATHATEFRRTRQTMAPLAKKCGVEIGDYSARASEQFAKGLAGKDAEPGLVVVAGHSNTVPQMVSALGGKLSGLTDKGWFGDDEYERVVIVTLCGPPGRRMQAVSTVDLRLEV